MPVSTAKVEASQAPVPTNNVPPAAKQATSKAIVEPDLLTYDSPLLGPGPQDASTQRDRMEAEVSCPRHFAIARADGYVSRL